MHGLWAEEEEEDGGRRRRRRRWWWWSEIGHDDEALSLANSW